MHQQFTIILVKCTNYSNHNAQFPVYQQFTIILVKCTNYSNHNAQFPVHQQFTKIDDLVKEAKIVKARDTRDAACILLTVEVSSKK